MWKPGSIGINIGVSPLRPATNSTLSLVKLSQQHVPTVRQIRYMYEAEKGMFVASAECLLQSGSTDAVLDVSVDPLGSHKVLVTQTDAITIFDGCVVDSKPTVNSGSSEKGKLWGNLRTEQNSANSYVTVPAVDQRQVNEMVRGMVNDRPAGHNLGEAKAWVSLKGTSTIHMQSSYNVKSITDKGTGHYRIDFTIPFKTPGATSDFMPVVVGMTENEDIYMSTVGHDFIEIKCEDQSSLADSNVVMIVCFGELENE